MDILLLQPWYSVDGHPYDTTNLTVEVLQRNYKVRVLINHSGSELKEVPSHIHGNFTIFRYNKKLLLKPIYTLLLGFYSLLNRHKGAVYWLDCEPFLALCCEILRKKHTTSLISLLNPPTRIRKWKVYFLVRLTAKFGKNIRFVVRTDMIYNEWVNYGIDDYNLIISPSPIISNQRALNTKDFQLSSKKKFLIFGQLRTGKSILELIRAFKELSLYDLNIRGPALEKEFLHQISMEASSLENVYLVDRFHNQTELEDAFVNNDFVLLLYDEHWSKYMESGILFLCGQYHKHVITYDDCWISDMVKKYGIGYIIDRNVNLADQIASVLTRHTIEEAVDARKFERFLNDFSAECLLFELFEGKNNVFS
ncbi:glycosyltransferase [Planktomarina temperata]|nr:glycosyltransferase [Planktomarina temperata]